MKHCKAIYVLCFVFDCRGNPLANAKVCFHLVMDGRKVSLGEVPTSGIRARPAGVMIKLPPDAHPHVDVQVLYGRLKSQILHLDAAENQFCEFVFHVDDFEPDWDSRKRRSRWRCRCADKRIRARKV